MALVVEDGSIIAGANSFVSRAEVIAYASARGITIPNDAAADVLAIKAMDFLLVQCYRGDGVTGAELPFPRYGLVTGDTAGGYAYTIPTSVWQAQLQLALDVYSGVDLTPSASATPLLKRSKVGPLEREFFAPGADLSPPLTVAMGYLAAFLCTRGIALSTVRA